MDPQRKCPIIVLNEQSNKRTPLPTYCYTHTEVDHWVSPERQLLAVHGSQLDKMQRVKDWTLRSKWDHTLIIIKALPPQGSEIYARARGGGWLHNNSIFQTQQVWCTYELPKTMTQVQTRQVPNKEKGKWAHNPTPYLEPIWLTTSGKGKN